MFRRTFFLLPLLLLCCPQLSSGQEEILTFHGKVMEQIQIPPDEATLTTLSQTKVDKVYCTFLGTKDQKVLLVQFADNKPDDIHKKIWLTARFVARPGATATAGEIIHWGYVFDRNGDGKVDYVALLFGAMPVKDKHFPKDYPKGTDPPVNGNALYASLLYLHGDQLVFRHIADDNFDGKVDSVVIEDADLTIYPPGSWIDSWLFLRATKLNDAPDEGWYFREDIRQKLRPAKSYSGYFIRRAVGTDKMGAFGPEELQEYTKMLKTINEAAVACGFTKNSFHQTAVQTPIRGKTFQQWVAQLQNPDSALRAQAAEALPAIGRAAKKAVPELISLLKDSDEQVCISAARALGALRADACDAIPALTELAEDNRPDVREAAQAALKEVTPRWHFSPRLTTFQAETYLIQVPDGEDWQVTRERSHDKINLIRTKKSPWWNIQTIWHTNPVEFKHLTIPQAAIVLFQHEKNVMVKLGVIPGKYTLSDVKIGNKTVGRRTFYFMTYISTFPHKESGATMVIKAKFFAYFPDNFKDHQSFYTIHISEMYKQNLEQPTMTDEFINTVLENFRVTRIPPPAPQQTTKVNPPQKAWNREESLPAKVLIKGVPFVNWHDTALLDYDKKQKFLINPSIPATTMMFEGYWLPDAKTPEVLFQQTSKIEKQAQYQATKGGTLTKIIEHIANGTPVLVTQSLTPTGHPFSPAYGFRLIMRGPKDLKLRKGPHSGMVGDILALEDLDTVKKYTSSNPCFESVLATCRVVVGYDNDRGVFLMHDPTFGPAWEVSYADFDRMWAACERQYLTKALPENHQTISAQRAKSPPYRARTPNEKAAEHYLMGYTLSATGEIFKGEQHFRTGLALPNISKGYQQLLLIEQGVTLMSQGRWEESFASLRKAAKNIPEDPLPWELLKEYYPMSFEPNRNQLAEEAEQQLKQLRTGDVRQRQHYVSGIYPSDFWIQIPGRSWAHDATNPPQSQNESQLPKASLSKK